MYKISMPIHSNTLNEKNREKYLEWIKAGEIDRIFIVQSANQSFDELSDETCLFLKDNIEYFEKNGVETGIWFGTSIGHPMPLSHENYNQKGSSFKSLIEADGNVVHGTACPLDKDFRNAICNCLTKLLKKTGAKLVLFDDDFRLSQRGCAPACCCEAHLALISEYYGKPVTIEDVRERVFKGEKTALREAYIKAQEYSMKLLANDLRQAVDCVREDVRLALCSAWSTWDIDGANAIELSKILAGKNTPLLRLHVAPYWATGREWTLCSVIETERMFASFCKGERIETMAEGDVYPRPRYKTPSAYLEIFDQALRADGNVGGCYKYMADYVSDAEYESGYARLHKKNLPVSKKITEVFGDKSCDGVRVYMNMRTFEDMRIYEDNPLHYLNTLPFVVGDLFSSNSIPTTYEGKGTVGFVSGEHARHLDLKLIEKGAIIDAQAAIILQERGVDVGINKILSYKYVGITDEYYASQKIKINENHRLLDVELNEKAAVVGEVLTTNGKKTLAYKYVNENGQKFFAFAFSCDEMRSACTLKSNYLRQAQLYRAIEWIADKKAPAYIEKSPELYIITKRQDKKLVVGLFNCFADPVLDPVVQLDKAYSKINFHIGEGRLEADKVILNTDIPAYQCVVFEVIDK